MVANAPTQITSKSADGKRVVSNANRWLVTAKQEAATRKISSLLPGDLT